MNKNNAKDYLPLVQALADGKVIQVKTVCGWVDSESIGFVFPPDQYRIKPEPREIWVNHCMGGLIAVFDSEREAIDYAKQYGGSAPPKRYREVIE